MQKFSKEETIEKIKKLEGIGALIKTQDDLRRVQRNLMDDISRPGGAYKY